MFAHQSVEFTDELLEDSARIYHRNVATIQRVFAAQWFETVGEYVGCEQIEHPDAHPAQVEALVVSRLAGYRRALRAKEGEMIALERDKRAARDAALWSYASRAAA